MTQQVAQLTELLMAPLNPVYFDAPNFTPAIDFLFDFWCGSMPWGHGERRALCQQLFNNNEFMAVAVAFDAKHGLGGTDNALTQALCEAAYFSDEWLRSQ